MMTFTLASLFRPAGLRKGLLALAVFSLTSLASAFDLTGTYGDKGTAISSEKSVVVGEPSLNAILNLDFTGENAAHAKAAELRIDEVGNALRIEVVDNDEQTLSRTTWAPADGYTKEESRRVLILRARDAGTTRYMLQFVPVSDGKLLEVTVVKVTTSAFGPITETSGVYVFPRL